MINDVSLFITDYDYEPARVTHVSNNIHALELNFEDLQCDVVIQSSSVNPLTFIIEAIRTAYVRNINKPVLMLRRIEHGPNNNPHNGELVYRLVVNTPIYKLTAAVKEDTIWSLYIGCFVSDAHEELL